MAVSAWLAGAERSEVGAPRQGTLWVVAEAATQPGVATHNRLSLGGRRKKSRTAFVPEWASMADLKAHLGKGLDSLAFVGKDALAYASLRATLAVDKLLKVDCPMSGEKYVCLVEGTARVSPCPLCPSRRSSRRG